MSLEGMIKEMAVEARKPRRGLRRIERPQKDTALRLMAAG